MAKMLKICITDKKNFVKLKRIQRVRSLEPIELTNTLDEDDSKRVHLGDDWFQNFESFSFCFVLALMAWFEQMILFFVWL